MKVAHFSRYPAFLLVAALVLCLTAAGSAQQPAGEDFPGVKRALSPEQYSAAGLDKLSPEERAKLDNYLRGYFSGATQKVVEQAEARGASKAVDRAVKEHRVEAPLLIETKLVGTYDGWKSDQIFVLENGQHWKVVENGKRYYPPVVNPDVFIVRDSFGYKMAVAGGGVVRVNRLQ